MEENKQKKDGGIVNLLITGVFLVSIIVVGYVFFYIQGQSSRNEGLVLSGQDGVPVGEETATTSPIDASDEAIDEGLGHIDLGVKGLDADNINIDTGLQDKPLSGLEGSKARAGEEITRQKKILSILKERIGIMEEFPSSGQVLLVEEVTVYSVLLTSLQEKILADTKRDVLGRDIGTLLDAQRAFALIAPKIELIASADRMLSLVRSLNAVADKMEARLTANTSVEANIARFRQMIGRVRGTAEAAALQGQKIFDLVAPLTPDNKYEPSAKANRAALQQARVLVRTATGDIRTAVKDIKTIRSALHLLSPVSSAPQP